MYAHTLTVEVETRTILFNDELGYKILDVQYSQESSTASYCWMDTYMPCVEVI